MRRSPIQVTLPATWLAALCGAVAGLLAFAATAAMWRTGHARAASTAADATFIATLATVAAVTLLAQPTRLRRARVPVSRALPRAWWPAQADPLPALAACAGTPLAVGAGVAALLFR